MPILLPPSMVAKPTAIEERGTFQRPAAPSSPGRLGAAVPCHLTAQVTAPVEATAWSATPAVCRRCDSSYDWLLVEQPDGGHAFVFTVIRPPIIWSAYEGKDLDGSVQR